MNAKLWRKAVTRLHGPPGGELDFWQDLVNESGELEQRERATPGVERPQVC